MKNLPFRLLSDYTRFLEVAAKFVQPQYVITLGGRANIADKRKASQVILASLLNIFPGACIDSDDIACINEKRYLGGYSRF